MTSTVARDHNRLGPSNGRGLTRVVCQGDQYSQDELNECQEGKEHK